MEELEQRHKKEQKELLAKIQAMKHGVPKGDKKRKKQVALDIAKLEAELNEKHAHEIKEFQAQDVAEKINKLELAKDSSYLNGTATIENQPTQKLSKAAKRREKKEAEERARQKRLEEGEEESKNHSRNIEANQFSELLLQKGFRMAEVNPDGNCLYNAVLIQLKDNSPEMHYDLKWLRESTSDHLLSHMDDFIVFTSNNTNGDMLTPEQYESYCRDIKDTNCWGGQLELKALSQILKRHIEVYQAASPKISIGEEFTGLAPIRLSYHRHQYGLGEHYNALLVDT